MSKKQLDDANEETTPRSTMAQLDAPKFPVFDPATPKVSILSIGMGELESAIELLIEAEQQTAKFQPQASAKAEFMRTNYDNTALPDTVSSCHRHTTTPLSRVYSGGSARTARGF